VEGAEIITPQARKIIDEQKKLMPKWGAINLYCMSKIIKEKLLLIINK
jgi:hypothetical protein